MWLILGLLGLLLIVLLVALGILAMGGALGWLIYSLVPACGPGSALVAGVVATGFSGLVLSRLAGAHWGFPEVAVSRDEDGQETSVVIAHELPRKKRRRRR